jgi:hypothetical protein
MLLQHHLEECRDRYSAYIERHDGLSRQVAENDTKRTEQLMALRSEMGRALDQQTSSINAMILKASGTACVLMMGGLASVAWYLLTHHV